MTRPLRCALVAAGLLLLTACDRTTGESRGVVEAIDAHAHSITLDHEAIPGLMDGMKMTFRIAPGVSLEGVEPGTRVEFQVTHVGDDYIITELRRAGS